MLTYRVTSKYPSHVVCVGYNETRESFFVRVLDITTGDVNDAPIAWEGKRFQEITNPYTLLLQAQPYIEITSVEYAELIAKLQRDKTSHGHCMDFVATPIHSPGESSTRGSVPQPPASRYYPDTLAA